MRRALLLLVAAIALLVVAVSPGGAGASTSDQSWTDPAGDALGGAPDLTAVSVSNDAAGTITMNVTVPMVANTAMFVFMDTNMNGNDSDPADRAVIAVGLGTGVVAPLTYDGSGNAVSIPSLRMGATATAVTLSFVKTDVGIDLGFGFWLATETEAQISGDVWGDEMPDGNYMYPYLLTTPPPPAPPTPAVKPMIGKPVSAKAPIAGKRFTVRFPVTSSVDKKPLKTGTAECKTTVAGKTVPHTHTFKGGVLKATVKIPKAAKGKKLRIAVQVTADKTTRKVFTFKVKK
jgi:hypothetical protein